ncbi:hypothetical protein [Methylotenera sp.]|uniref:hypothetical protein n=1 Tax=Methylotenera sp. TaxID=2051956 RepID=UPI002727B3B8|nr:hypothetical protein [Methylotenera sp.]MDO9203842.1 hypothetical protein [Methylotenera sp.]MDP1524094.1 hypothetical protein [Methylotenera sp.]MDP2070620.1 hypothetical protein [Methylotenera sp.]MDP2231296.1 hypothetical protein [Methylotenera sp.]MDP3004899.1 hypothetical protein [Methylotenera sp.]
MTGYDYEAAFWDVRRKLEDLKSALTVIVAMTVTYLIRFIILGSSEGYMRMAKAWDMVDLIAMMFIFFGLALSVRKILNLYFSSNKIIP